MQVLAIDLGGTQIRAAVVDEKGQIIETKKTLTEADKSLEFSLEKLFDLSNYFISNYDIQSIGIGVPGPLDYEAGIILNPPNLPAWRNVKIKEILSDKYNLPIALDRDANAALIGEHWIGSAKGHKNVAMLTWGTGIGGAVIADNHIYRGHSDLAGELGHIIIDEKGSECPLGHRGCLESFIGGAAINKRYNLTFNEIIDLVRKDKNDPFFQKNSNIISDIGNALNVGIRNVIVAFDPELVLLGGGAIQSIDIFYKYIQDLPVKVSEHALDAGILGAARIALDITA